MQATAHTSFWQETSDTWAAHYPALDAALHVDVAVIGGGLTGLTAALHLRQAGRRVAVLESGHIGSGTTGFTSGHLDATTDTPLSRLILDFGEERAATIAAANREAIDQIELRCRQYNNCEFSRIPSYQYTETADGLGKLQEQCAAGRKLGYRCWFTRQVPLPFPCVGAVQVEHQARFHPLHYLQQMAAELHALGGEVFENTACLPPQGGSPCHVDTDGGRVTADAVVIATHSPFLGISQFEFRVFPYQSYVIAARVEDPPTDALYWDDADPYHYLRLASAADPTLVLIGGADHKTGHPGDERLRFEELENYAARRFAVRGIEQRWSAQYYAPADGLPHIGRVPGSDNLLMATGFAGTGLTWGTVAGSLIARMILGQRHPLEDILNPGRLTLMASTGEMVAENLDVIRRFAVDRFTAPRSSEDEIAPGSGRVITQHGRTQAIYRDASGDLHRFSAVCTHAGCIVHWNEAEQTWDCPCHGGRFTAHGQRFAGPPAHDLAIERSNGKPAE
jgi:glycine/D-amino acid oxidase-like deaminating enzyme/nitrite reductase/ring-hydroxylating ferredoxin subunit